MEMETLQGQRQGLWLQTQGQVEGQGLQPTFMVLVLNNFESSCETTLGCQRRDPIYINVELYNNNTGVLHWDTATSG